MEYPCDERRSNLRAGAALNVPALLPGGRPGRAGGGPLLYALSELGQREQALAATREAAELRLRLAQAQSGAFLPDLAAGLRANGRALLGLGRAAEAAQAFGEGLRDLRPFLRADPQACGGLAGALLEHSLKRAGRWAAHRRIRCFFAET